MQVDDSARIALRRTLLARAQTIPGVEHATWVNSVPLQSENSTALYVAGIDAVDKLGRFTYVTATDDYFRALGTRILRGRGFTPDDRANAPRIAVISEGMARTLWPGRDAIGQCFRVFSETSPCTTVVGIAEDMVQNELTATKRFHYYLPIEQNWPAGGFALLLKLGGDPGLQAESVRKALQAEMPGQSYVTMRPMRELISSAQRSWRLGASMFTMFGLLALLVAAVGVYGVIGYNVSQRRHELGLRVALGAQVKNILLLVVGQGLRFVIMGIALGVVCALGMGRYLQPLLFQQSASDPAIHGLVGGVLLMVAILSCAVPALRAARVNPNVALKAE
jgi:predicted permease